MLALRQGMANVTKELEYQQRQTSRDLGDRFSDVIGDFEVAGLVQLAEVEDKLIDSKTQVTWKAKKQPKNLDTSPPSLTKRLPCLARIPLQHNRTTSSERFQSSFSLLTYALC